MTLFLVQYVWDDAKAASNISKHGVSFDEAVTVFEDADALHESDTARGEFRVNVIGYSSRGRILFVVALEVVDGEVLRIISARKANHAEQRKYHE